MRAARDAVGRAGTRTHIDAYARIALAPWFVLGGVVPLALPALAAERLSASRACAARSLIVLACAALAGCGGGGSSNSSGPPDALLHPAKLKAKAPQLFTVDVQDDEGRRSWSTFTARGRRTAPTASTTS